MSSLPLDAHAPHASAGQPAHDDDLVRAAQRDPGAFGPLYRRHAPAIERYLRRRLGDPTLVEDVLAETFMQALDGIARYERRGIPFRA